MIVEEYNVKHVESLIRTASPSLFSWHEIYLNPYQGCYHDCKYCDGKSENYYMHKDFSNRIKVKINAPRLLEKYFKRKDLRPINRNEPTLDEFIDLKIIRNNTFKPKFIINPGGGVCDIYQPIERKIKITRRLLQVIYDYNIPVHILTKNDLVLRDLDLVRSINEKTHASINFTITLANENIQKIFEPQASTTIKRFEALKKIREEGIHGGVYLYPLLPFISDSAENMELIFSQAKKAKAEFVYVGMLTLKPGRSKIEFLYTIKQHFPHLLSKYEQLYGDNNKYGNLNKKFLKETKSLFPEINAFKLNYEFKLPYSPPRYIPSGRIKNNLLISEVLLKISYLKKYILREKNRESNNLTDLAMRLEKSQYDVLELSQCQFNKIFHAENAYSYIKDYSMNDTSTKLKNMEQHAYNIILNEVQNSNLN